jgi:hypothetical protein
MEQGGGRREEGEEGGGRRGSIPGAWRASGGSWRLVAGASASGRDGWSAQGLWWLLGTVPWWIAGRLGG